MNIESVTDRATLLFRQHGTLRTSEAMALGIHPRTLYALHHEGILERLGRGLYRLSDLPPLSDPDLVTVARKVSRGVICLISALAYYELTTQVPHVVDVALRKGDKRPCLDRPPLRVFWFSGPAWSEGIQIQRVDETDVRIYSAEKSVADSFKFRNRIGLDVALEALRAYCRSPGFDVNKLLHYTRICRVEKVIRPYLEALL